MASPKFASSPSTHATLAADMLPLLKEHGGGWELSQDGMALEMAYEFGGFNKAWGFMSAVSEEAKAAKHHPEWANVYNRVLIRWTTHKDRETKESGLSALDIQLATRCTELARKFEARKELGVQADEASESGLAGLKGAVEKLASCNVCKD